MTDAVASEQAIAGALAELVGAIGSATFSGRFLNAMRVLAGAELCSVFRRDRGQPVELLFAKGHPPLPDFPMRASLEYARNYWRSDHQITRLARSARAGPVVVRKRASDIADPAWRTACYDRAGVVERLSIVSCGPSIIFANGYRTAASAPFASGDIARLETYSALLMAAVERHLRAAVPALDETAVIQLLMGLHCGLSSREAEISAAMILGQTQDEIATRTRLSHGSVVTYRRRAYGKLGVANRRGLVALHRRLIADPGQALQ